MTEPARPAPLRTQDNEPFWAAAAEGRLVAQRCSGCAQLHHPPRPMCPSCGSTSHRWEALSGLGTVYSYAVLHHPQHPAFDYPLVAALVDLDEGVRLLSNIVGMPPDRVHIGMRVEAMFVPTAGGAAVPVFQALAEL